MPDAFPYLLAFDTSTELLSVALQSHGTVQERTGPGGAQSSTTLIPLAQALLAEAGIGFAQLQAVVFGRGPGSFTGLRTACAAAQGMAYGARAPQHPQGLPVLPVDTLAAVAEAARADSGATRVVATLDARMDEVYLQPLAWDETLQRWLAEDGHARLARPEDIVVPTGWTLAGNARAAYGERIAPSPSVHVLPHAAALLRLAPGLIAAGGLVPASGALPLYVRDKVAQTTAERLAARAAAAGG
ncbi:tRNA (adenosine(37)-N6)-threonylcarbamoyltransferase complex dimerization subunit type 1 TsaB [Xylophilus sp. Kf1]|nr:tRNA (adenosine(37)-N6)-threonylcarbamoyltransferase complex dimerization subunit type 1 TsaB [Xylophilus sp. Kf1]